MAIVKDDYSKDENKKVDIGVRIETLAAIIANHYLYTKENLYVGDSRNNSIPDIYNEKLTIGYEVTQSKNDLDFAQDDCIKKMRENNFNSNSCKNIVNEDDRLKDDYYPVSSNGQVQSLTFFDSAHDYSWRVESFKCEFTKKTEKLNKGRYENCKHVSLILVDFNRKITKLDVEPLREAYFEMLNNELKDYALSFENVYFFTTDCIYGINNKNVEIMLDEEGYTFNDCVQEMKKLLK